MHSIDKSNAIDFYLLAKHFPDFEQYISKEELIGGFVEPETGSKRVEVLAEWRRLRNKSTSERRVLFEEAWAEYLRLFEQERAIAMHLLGGASGPVAVPDFAWWAKYAELTSEEATALSLGLDPGHVSWHAVGRERYWCALAARLISVHTLISRAVKVGDLPSPLRPSAFVRWAAGRLDLPPALINAVQAAPEPKAKCGDDPETVDQVDARRMNSWCKVVVGMAQKLGHQPEKKRNSTAKRVSGYLDEIDRGLSEDTVLSIIKEAHKKVFPT